MLFISEMFPWLQGKLLQILEENGVGGSIFQNLCWALPYNASVSPSAFGYRVRSERIHYGCVRGCDSHVQTHWLLLCILNTELSTSWLTEFVKVFLTRSFESRRHHYVSSVNTAAQMSCQDFSWIFEHKVIYLWSQWSMHPCIKYHCSAFYNMKEESICSVGFLHIMFLNTI